VNPHSRNREGDPVTITTNSSTGARPPSAPAPANQWLLGQRRAQRVGERLMSVAGWLIGLGLGVTVALAVSSESLGSLTAPGGLMTAAGRLTGLVGTYLMLVSLLLVARIPWIERAAGQERLVRWHRLLGPWPIVLLVAHAALITVGYAAASAGGVAPMAWQLVTQYPNVLAATVALVLMVTAGVTSWRVARRRLRHETWWTIHLYLYLAAALALAHQVTAGAAFVSSPTARVWWLGMWAATAGTVLVFRVLLPLWRSIRHGLRVVEVRPEGSGTFSVIMRGRGLHRLSVRGGQFLHWRFFKSGHVWQSHPYSLSAMPQNGHVRITVKALGDHSSELAGLKPGTRVAVEGAYGRLTREVLRRDRVLLLAGGVGITPLRALLEDLPQGIHPVVIVRASADDDVIFRQELEMLVNARGGRFEAVVGSRRDVVLDHRQLLRLVPDIADRDVLMCGPDGLVDQWKGSLSRLGVPMQHMHSESFGV
jgi:predicted ferric reductase